MMMMVLMMILQYRNLEKGAFSEDVCGCNVLAVKGEIRERIICTHVQSTGQTTNLNNATVRKL